MFKNYKKIVALITTFALMFITGFSSMPVKAVDEADKIEALNGGATVECKTVDVLSFNDFHGSALESGKNIGAAKLTGVVKEYQGKENENYGVIPVAGGDLFQGSAISNLTQGEPEIDMIKAMGLQVSAVGNHEFDWGTANFKTWQKDGNFEFLAANMVDEKTGEPADFVKPYKIIEKNGIKVAFIGLATEETLTSTKAENTVGLKFEEYKKTLEKYIPIVKEQGANVVVALTHCGSYQDKDGNITGEAADLANQNIAGLDAIVSAHSHKFVSGKVNNIPVVQAGNNGRALAKISFKFDKDNKLVSVEPQLTKFQGNEKNLPEDPEVKAQMDALQEKLKGILNEHVTALDERLNNDDKYSNLTDLGVKVSETMRQTAGTQIAVNNGGGIRRSLEKGEVTVGDMYEILPFDNYIETMDLSGAELKKVIQHGI
ncbi:MAG: 5'-nucleotidase C-terminal domain-containing protein, partial [Clostridiaceae bacterium]|nr:5'-nucleotidase C-terminal domain-containing protein [Clostridiaceae bacterium]